MYKEKKEKKKKKKAIFKTGNGFVLGFLFEF
jgi:hypothetical protein